MALAVFNDVIVRSAVEAGAPMIDLRLVCDQFEPLVEGPLALRRR